MIQARGSLRKGSQRFFLMVQSANLALTDKTEVSEGSLSACNSPAPRAVAYFVT